MKPHISPTPAPEDPHPYAERILHAARERVFTRSNPVFTMDDLAGDLGMSKKTIYQFFPGKDAILGAIVESMGRSIHSQLEAIVSDESLRCPEKLSKAIGCVGLRLSKVSPTLLRILKREAPAVYQRMEELRRRNIPHFFGRILESGKHDGTLRGEVDTGFAAELWFHAIRGLMDPETLDRTQRTPQQTLQDAAAIFFQGVLSESGRALYRETLNKKAP
ncbi:MAG: TetR/AcrR family transcriptional regulator [Opitutaceae bacterium]|nr:TetR/AcrR family transcriptional regulator [Opitutaceae bacterium]